jgi:putative membrane protein
MKHNLRNTVRALALMIPLAAFVAACDSENDITGLNGQQEQIIASMQSDADIMGVLHQSNLNEINEANLALSTASDTGVRSFAQMMVTDHTTLDQQGSALAASLGITPILRDSTLVQEAATAMAQLGAQSGTAFDRLYMDKQVDDHQQTLAIVDAAIQTATDNTLRAALATQVRPVIVAHLQMAEDIQARIGQ